MSRNISERFTSGPRLSSQKGLFALFEELTLPLPRLQQATRSEVDLPALVEAHAGTLFRVAHSLLRDRAEAEDAVQDAFVRVLEHRGDLPGIRDLRPWLIRIVWNVALDRRKRRRPDQAAPDLLHMLPATHVPADQALVQAQQSARVYAAIDRLPAVEREVLLLSALEELSTAEIATAMSKSESAIRSLQHRAKNHLRERLVKGGRP